MKKAISKIIAKYPRPDQSLLPKVWLEWGNSKGTNWCNCQTGDITQTPPEWFNLNGRRYTYHDMKQDNIMMARGADIRYAYCKYHNAVELIEFAVVEMSSRGKDGARFWEYTTDGKRYFLDKNKNIYTSEGELIPDGSRFEAFKYHNAWSFYSYLGILSRLKYNDAFLNEFKKYCGDHAVIVGNGRILKLNYAWELQEWYRSKSYRKSTGKVQKLLDEVTSLPHSDLSNICKRYPVIQREERYYSSTISDVIYFEQLNDTWSVLRYCYRLKDDDCVESYRVYVSENGDCKMAKINDLKEWTPAQNMTDGWRRSYGRIVNFDEMSKCKRLSYIMPILSKFPLYKQLQYLVSIVKFPQIEKLAKMGYDNLVSDLLIDNTVNANIKERFGDVNKKAKTIYGEFGLNKHQLDVYAKSCVYRKTDYTEHTTIDGRYYIKSLGAIKKYFGNDISSMDDDTFDKLLTFTSMLNSVFWRGITDSIDTLNVDGQRFLKNMSRLLSKSEDAYHTSVAVKDAINMYLGIDAINRPEIDWIFDDYSDITRIHDSLVEIKRIQDAERRAMWDMKEAERLKKEDEKRKKVDAERKCYEYEDDAYIIRLPKDCKEIVTEGNKQHICIGGYTSRHSLGNTNLFFLRKKSEPDAPFYAIEMDNNKQIVQIHGFGNKWLGNDPAAIPTVIRWLRKNDIKCTDKILTCTSIGYSGYGACIAMPVVD